MNVPRVFTALVLVAGVAAPCVAADDAKPDLTTLSKSSQALLSTGRQSAPRFNQQTTPTRPADSNQFFRTKKGATVVAILVAGFGYTLYSRFHDEIKSSVREQ